MAPAVDWNIQVLSFRTTRRTTNDPPASSQQHGQQPQEAPRPQGYIIWIYIGKMGPESAGWCGLWCHVWCTWLKTGGRGSRSLHPPPRAAERAIRHTPTPPNRVSRDRPFCFRAQLTQFAFYRLSALPTAARRPRVRVREEPRTPTPRLMIYSNSNSNGIWNYL